MATDKQKCPCCGKNKSMGTYDEKKKKWITQSSFYQSPSVLYKGNDGMMVHCKDCVSDEYERILLKLVDEKASVKATCMKFNISYDESILDAALNRTANAINKKKENSKASVSTSVFKNYMTVLNSLGMTENLGNPDDDFNTIDVVTNIEKNAKVEKELSPQQKMNKIQKEATLTEEEELAKKDCINLLGSDPFLGCSIFDQKYLYTSLLPQLNEDVLEDGYLLSQYIQIINNNNQIRKIDLTINLMSSDVGNLLKNQGDIKSLTSTKNQIVGNNDKIAKENGISLKNRGDKKAGKSTLTYTMKNLRELGFEDAEADYYDELKSYGMQKASEASTIAIMGQLRLDENDYTSVIANQREMVQKMTQELDDLKEENRVLHKKLAMVGED